MGKIGGSHDFQSKCAPLDFARQRSSFERMLITAKLLAEIMQSPDKSLNTTTEGMCNPITETSIFPSVNSKWGLLYSDH